MERAGSLMEGTTGRLAGLFTSLGSAASAWGLPFGETAVNVGEKLAQAEENTRELHAAQSDLAALQGRLAGATKVSEAQHLQLAAAESRVEEATKKVSGTSSAWFQKLSAVGGTALVAGVAGLAAFGAEAVHMGDEMGSATAQISTSEGVSQKAAQGIADSFKHIRSEEPATAMASAFAAVAGQLEAVQGHALTTAQADQVMAASADLADGKYGSLAQTTSAVATILQTYQLSAKNAGSVSDTLAGLATKAGLGLGEVTSTVQRLRTQLGVTSPSLADTGALILDLANHGETGRAAMSSVSVAFQTLLRQIAPAAPAVKNVAAEQAKLTKQHEAEAKAAIAVSNAEARLADTQTKAAATPWLDHTLALTTAQNALATAELNLKAAQESVNTSVAAAPAKLTPAQQEAQKLGLHIETASHHFVGMRSVIEQLAPKLRGMTQDQQLLALQQLLGASANRKLLETFLAGPAAFDKASAAVNQVGNAHASAEAQMHTLDGQAKVLGSSLENLGTSAGEWLIPKLTAAATETEHVVEWFEKNKTAAYALGGVISGVLGLAVGAFVINKLVSFTQGLKDAGTAVGNLISKITGFGGGGVDKTGEGAAEALDTSAGKLASAQEGLTGAATKLSESAGQLSAAADKLAGSGVAPAAEIKGAGETAALDLDAAGAETAAELKAGSAETGGLIAGAMAPLLVAALADAASNWLPGAHKVAPGDVGVEKVTSKIPILGPLGNNIGNSIVNWIGPGGTAGVRTPPPAPPGYVEMSSSTGMEIYRPASGSGRTYQWNPQTGQWVGGAPPASGPAGGTGSYTPSSRQSGGTVYAGMPYNVSEDEVFMPGQNGQIVPLSQMASSALGGQGQVPMGSYTIYQIDKLIVVAQNPAEMQQQLTAKARRAALSGNPLGGANLAVAS